jgi:hypothetical protein
VRVFSSIAEPRPRGIDEVDATSKKLSRQLDLRDFHAANVGGIALLSDVEWQLGSALLAQEFGRGI